MEKSIFVDQSGLDDAPCRPHDLHWEQIPTVTLERIERDYRRARRTTMLGQWINIASVLLVVLSAACGLWLWNHFRAQGLDQGFGLRQLFVLLFFFATLCAVVEWLRRIRRSTRVALDGLSEDLRDIACVLWFRKQHQ
ncbi:hypothetical protein [Pseudomonas chlororaphis]|uniref:Transmembrane protein n=1 Tax=Pseudomonas chlororaphis TaxID=587753 RepID=A0AAX3G6F8_9PSED|nr:hypothetical protein [Pseudomonas chlororaphis]AZC37162.1 hypothetical protein C4K37_2775 [Pseudomonas chlororaphis subsp. piscium]AZC43708.1 hypothetical protein C4K36_2783 [Pseudomonas chlororaphis subsp. piscium]AZC89037.1 hypothetical protein C4K29_2736 [Pseudomonas chlororaphis subsp. piscium]AZC95423.1 hypothetical protein C4K28_2695 [Pseudomonas chlororaphis subsp. piscium]WDG75574.1 hypothetical protein PUP65_14730 [Pseudomonas chlororaphis]